MEDKIPVDILQSLAPDIVKEYSLIPYGRSGDSLLCYRKAGCCPDGMLDMLSAVTGCRLSVSDIDAETFTRLYVRNYRDGLSRKAGAGRDFLYSLINEAYTMYSSDIHFECYESRYRIRFRIDGRLMEQYSLEHGQYISLVNQIKILSMLDIAEKRLPQDGRIAYRNGSVSFDVRVSVMPSVYGEKVVMRLLTRQPELLDLDNLGLDARQLSDYRSAIGKPFGMVLISGPTGSGKSTTLYATLRVLNREWNNIVTIEDPVEYTLDGVNQVQLKEEVGLSFPVALRTFLRQDPDVIMVGEIRDQETAQMAVRSSLTGHLVLSTIHTNSAYGCVRRLSEMGVHRYLIADTVVLMAAQRLVRLLCPYCRQEYTLDGVRLCRPVGCSRCFYTGYKGRKAIYEVVPVDDEVRDCIRRDSSDIGEVIRRKGISTLQSSGYRLLRSGETSLEEVLPFAEEGGNGFPGKTT